MPYRLPSAWQAVRTSRTPSKGVVVYLLEGCPACKQLLPEMKSFAKESNGPMYYGVYPTNVPARIRAFPHIVSNGKHVHALPKPKPKPKPTPKLKLKLPFAAS